MPGSGDPLPRAVANQPWRSADYNTAMDAVDAHEDLLTSVRAFQDDEDAQADTTSTSYGDLDAFGTRPIVGPLDLQAGQLVEVTVSAAMFSNATGPSMWMSFEVTGATTLSAVDKNGAKGVARDITDDAVSTRNTILTMTGSGLTSFGAKYRVNTGTGIFWFRRIIVKLL